jgi:leader peptidase (prepilin peptidase)/N-methyltransferase
VAHSLFVTSAAACLGMLLGLALNIGFSRRTDSPDILCPVCQSPTSLIGNAPFLSWFRITVRCSACDWRETAWINWRDWGREVLALHNPKGEKLSVSSLVVGLCYAALWAIPAWAWGVSFQSLHAVVFGSFLLAIAISDGLIKIIPGEYTVPGILCGLLLSVTPAGPGLVRSLVGCLTGAALIWVLGVVGTWVAGKEAMGGGDIDLMAMVGAFLGPRAVFLTVFLGAFAGTLTYGPLLLVRREWGQQIPFGVYLALGAGIAFVAGDALVREYLRLVLG